MQNNFLHAFRFQRSPLAVLLMWAVILCPIARARAEDDAAALYLRAGQMVADTSAKKIDCPASSTLNYISYPPFPDAWNKLEAVDFPANQPARDLAHRARLTDKADWPEIQNFNPELKYLSLCRGLSNELADAALYQHLQGDDAAAFDTIRDDIHLSDSLENADKEIAVMLLVGVGIRAQAIDRLNVIASRSHITGDPLNKKGVQSAIVRELMNKLLKHPTAKEQVDRALETEDQQLEPLTENGIEKLTRTANRINAECDLSAMALAVRLYRFDRNAWPATSNDLKDYLPNLPLDPMGDGKQPLGYVLIKHGLPGGSDRPLVYTRFKAKDNLFYIVDQPHYSYYSGDGSQRPAKDQKNGGQFRDGVGWVPKEGHESATAPLPE